MEEKILIVGGDSRLGNSLKTILKKKKLKFIETSRRKKNSSVFLNLNNVKKFRISKKITSCVILSGITNYNECEKNKKKSKKINCENTSILIKELLRKKIFTCYISTNTIFNKKSKPGEKTLPNPNFEYARQKYITEKNIFNYSKINNLEKFFCVLRLTKNVGISTSPFYQWIENIINKKKIIAFEDLYFSPILFINSANIILKVLKKKKPGIFHLSNKSNLNYYSFARKLIKYLKNKDIRIKKTQSFNEGVKLIYKNKKTSLSMKNTINVLDVNYIGLEEIFKFFKKIINEKKNYNNRSRKIISNNPF